tara:strand:+ start:509 stop:937 length:429 start_codon:yes stop_codon:yes gene_type:complete
MASFGKNYLNLKMQMVKYEKYCDRVKENIHRDGNNHIYFLYRHRIIPQLHLIIKKLLRFLDEQKYRIHKQYESIGKKGINAFLTNRLGEDVSLLIASYYVPTSRDVETILSKENTLQSHLYEYSLENYLHNNNDYYNSDYYM